MRFKSAEQMHEYIVEKGDLYNKITGHYIFEYNDAHALAICGLSWDEMLHFAGKAIAQGENHISAVLNKGGIIYDNSEYDHYRYSENETERALYLKPSMDFCREWCNAKRSDFIPASEFFTLAKIEEVEDFHFDGLIDVNGILQDTVRNADPAIPGLFLDIFQIWKSSTDKESVEQVFYKLTGTVFLDFIEKCRQEGKKGKEKFPYPVITESVQRLYESYCNEMEKNGETSVNEVPCICGCYGRACRSLNKPADTMLCNGCTLYKFAATFGEILKRHHETCIREDDIEQLVRTMEERHLPGAGASYIESITEWLGMIKI